MLLRLLFMLPVVLAAPELKVNWTDVELSEVRVRVSIADELLTRCLKSGLALEYKYEMQLCRRRTVWFDACAPERTEKRVLRYDPVSDGYSMVMDRFGDEPGPQTLNLASLDEARSALTELEAVPLNYLAGDEEDLAAGARTYLRVRVQSDCRGDYNRTLARISSFLTMGLLRISGFDTHWVEFKLVPPAAGDE